MSKDKVIKFVSDTKILEEFWPRPIGKELPDWFRKMPAYGGYDGAGAEEKRLSGNDATYNSTIKRCVPMLDSLSLGYVLLTHQDVYVKIDAPKEEDDANDVGGWQFSWRAGVSPTKAVEGHAFGQASEHPLASMYGGRDVHKWINPWRIETPPGYSTLFVPPMNNPNGYFTALPGVVDTDTYTNCVNFPFVIEKKEWEGIIPAGTPVVQVIPFKRESWKMEIGVDQEMLEKHQKAELKFKTHIASVYRRFFWQRKEFK